MKQIVILGAGISGLSLAWFLKKKYKESVHVTLIEKNTRVGGMIQTIRKEGFLFELGPHSCRPTGHGAHTLALIQDLGLQSEVITPDPSAKRRYLLMNKKLVPFPYNLISTLTSPLTPVLLKALWNDWKAKRAVMEEETIDEFACRRFGQQAATYLFDPMTTGIFAGSSKQLSVTGCFPFLTEWEGQYGSIGKALLRHKKDLPTDPFIQQLSQYPFFSLRDGMESLATSLQAKLDADILLSCEATSLEITPEGIGITLSNQKQIHADFLFSTLPAAALSSLILPHDQTLAHTLQTIPRKSITVVSVGYRKSLLKLRGFGYLVPSCEKELVLGMMWDSSIFPQQNGCSEETRLTVMLPYMEADHALSMALKTIEQQLHISCLPDVTHITVAKEAIPQYIVGHGKKTTSIKQALHALSPRIRCLGNSFHGVAVNDCIAQAHEYDNQLT